MDSNMHCFGSDMKNPGHIIFFFFHNSYVKNVHTETITYIFFELKQLKKWIQQLFQYHFHFIYSFSVIFINMKCYLQPILHL